MSVDQISRQITFRAADAAVPDLLPGSGAAAVSTSTLDSEARFDPLDPGARLAFDEKLLQTFPEGYRYLAYLQTKLGFKIKMDMPQLKGPVVQALYAHGRAWLEGATSPFPN